MWKDRREGMLLSWWARTALWRWVPLEWDDWMTVQWLRMVLLSPSQGLASHRISQLFFADGVASEVGEIISVESSGGLEGKIHHGSGMSVVPVVACGGGGSLTEFGVTSVVVEGGANM